jgi:regulatory protein SWI5
MLTSFSLGTYRFASLQYFQRQRLFRTLQAYIMLSNPTNTLHNRQRQHRRQNSTPTAFSPVKANNLPNIHQKHGAHRRGMSLDQQRRQTPPQDVTLNTNLGYQMTQQQHILRETQQQRLVRPGQHFNLDNDENYLSSPAITPQRQSFDAGFINYGERVQSQPQYDVSGPIEGLTYVHPANFTGVSEFDLFAPDSRLTPSAYLDFSTTFDNVASMSNANGGSRRSSAGRRISDGIVDRVTQFEHMALPPSQRPVTPQTQNVSSTKTFHNNLVSITD